MSLSRELRTEPAKPTGRHGLRMLGGVAAVALLVPFGLLVALFAVGDEPIVPPAGEKAPTGPAHGALASPPSAEPDVGGWDIAAQTALATRPMPGLPEEAALPHALTERTAGPPIVLPAPADPAQPLPVGFPATVEGAIAQLAALTRAGLEGGDPQRYRHAYELIMLPGAPPAEAARLQRDLRRVRAGVFGLPPTGAVPGLEFTWIPTSALVKGTTDGGRYAVVCVLGELVSGRNGQSISTGAGDCQALRRVGDRWRISPGMAAAPASLAWPGTAEAVRIGFRAVRS